MSDTDTSMRDDISSERSPRSDASISQRVLLFCGGVLIIGGAVGMIYSALLLVTGESKIVENASELKPLAYLFFAHSTVVVLNASALLAILMGIWITGRAVDVGADVIPMKDRRLLEHLIANKDEAGITQYVRIASLSGQSGFFTKLGFTGLPLATAGLGILLVLLSIGMEFGGKVEPAKQLMDLAKLVLGAFIGSFVQRKVSQKGGENLEDTI